MTLCRYFGGQPVRSFYFLDSGDFNQLMESERALDIYRQCRATSWLLFAPFMLALVAYQFPPNRKRLLRSLLICGSAAVAVSLLAASFSFIKWSGNGPILIVSIAPLGGVSIGGGGFMYQSHLPKGWPQYYFSMIQSDASPSFSFWALTFASPKGMALQMPTWMLIWITGLPTLALYLASRRPLPGHCRCGYNLTGNTSGICPECGNPTKNTLAVSTSDSSPA